MWIAWAAIAFGAGFGGVLVFAGARRVLSASGEAKPGEARVWGAVGVAMGFALIVYALWLAWGRLVAR